MSTRRVSAFTNDVEILTDDGVYLRRTITQSSGGELPCQLLVALRI